jgi:hypothetical protein
MQRQPVGRPVVGERTSPERGAMDFAQLGAEREWIDLLDDQRRYVKH